MSSGLRRSKAVKYHRTPPSSETSAGPSEPSQAQYKNPQSSTATSRHTAPDEVTEAESHAVLSGKLPANRGELNQRRKAVCYVDFNSTIDHEPIGPTRAALHALKLRTDELMVSPAPESIGCAVHAYHFETSLTINRVRCITTASLMATQCMKIRWWPETHLAI